MPTFCFLFNDSRGDDLVAYLASFTARAPISTLQKSLTGSLLKTHGPTPMPHSRALYHQRCATCHASDGQTRLAWESDFKRLPPILQPAPISGSPGGCGRRSSAAPCPDHQVRHPRTDMPGHEYLSDHDITSVAVWLSKSSHSRLNNNRHRFTQETTYENLWQSHLACPALSFATASLAQHRTFTVNRTQHGCIHLERL